MRHCKKGRKFGRKNKVREGLINSLIVAFFRNNGRMKTTLAKAKEIRPVVEKIITTAKDNSLFSIRKVSRTIKGNNRDIIFSIFNSIAPQFKDRNGGYTRIIKLGRRQGDAAEMAIIELVTYEGEAISTKVSEESKSQKTEQSKTVSSKNAKTRSTKEKSSAQAEKEKTKSRPEKEESKTEDSEDKNDSEDSKADKNNKAGSKE